MSGRKKTTADHKLEPGWLSICVRFRAEAGPRQTKTPALVGTGVWKSIGTENHFSFFLSFFFFFMSFSNFFSLAIANSFWKTLEKSHSEPEFGFVKSPAK